MKIYWIQSLCHSSLSKNVLQIVFSRRIGISPHTSTIQLQCYLVQALNDWQSLKIANSIFFFSGGVLFSVIFGSSVFVSFLSKNSSQCCFHLSHTCFGSLNWVLLPLLSMMAVVLGWNELLGVAFSHILFHFCTNAFPYCFIVFS